MRYDEYDEYKYVHQKYAFKHYATRPLPLRKTYLNGIQNQKYNHHIGSMLNVGLI